MKKIYYIELIYYWKYKSVKQLIYWYINKPKTMILKNCSVQKKLVNTFFYSLFPKI